MPTLSNGSRAAFALGLGCAILGYAAGLQSQAQPEPDAAQAESGVSATELEQLVAPIALYPDELLAVALPASTYPLQIVQAARLLEKRKTELDLEPDEDWDPSVIGLMNYPEVIKLMNDDLDWTWKLGEAVADRQPEVMAAVQSFRHKVDAAGNLESNDKATVVKEKEGNETIIVIESASPEVIYVPSYEPSVVVVHHMTPYPYYYSRPYPYYYSPHAAFWTGMFVGSAIGWGLHWGHHGHSSIDIHRNVNINVDRPTRPSTPDRPGNRPGAGGREAWKADKGRGKQSGARPGGDRRACASTRPAAGKAARPSAGGAGKRTRQSGRDLTSPGTSKRASNRSSLGSYGKGSQARSHGSRGAASRGASRAGSHGGGRAGGGRGGGRRR